jgi:RNA polymerase sigma factor (sigma-70 family)
MTKDDWLTERFEENRPRLKAVAYRMLGSVSEAEDALQESWVRLSRADTSSVENPAGWLTTVVARVCLDMLRSRRSHREEPLTDSSIPVAGRQQEFDPETEALLADSVGPALLVVLDTLAPAERLAFVLHDMFGVSFEEIATIVGRSPAAVRQLASRARRRVRGATAAPHADIARQRRIVDAFFAASREGNFEALMALLDPEVVFRSDPAAVRAGGPSEVYGADSVARTFLGRARAVQPALVDGAPGALVTRRGELFLALAFKIVSGKIIEIDAIADRESLAKLDISEQMD